MIEESKMRRYVTAWSLYKDYTVKQIQPTTISFLLVATASSQKKSVFMQTSCIAFCCIDGAYIFE